MASFSTEVTSSKIQSDNPLYQRTSKAYHIVKSRVTGNTLEIGCGEGYGVSLYIDNTTFLTLVDKSKDNLDNIHKRYPNCRFFSKHIPPLPFLDSESFDTIISFQVIEHLKDPELFVSEIHRLLKPGGKAYITTPNKLKSIARNPWHYKEFNFDELNHLLDTYFNSYSIKGIEGNDTTDAYYMKNAKSVRRILRFDIFNLEKHLPSALLRIPYEILNRFNRNNLLKEHNTLVNNITLEDYSLNNYNKATLDFYCILEK